MFWSKNLEDIICLSNDYVFHGDLEKIIEVTYSYRDIWDWYILNETLFEEYTWDSYSQNDIVALGRKYKYRVQVQIVLIEDILKKTHKIRTCSRQENLRRGMFVDALEYVKTILEISVLAVDFEMEKSWIPHGLTTTKLKKRIQEIENREKHVFGAKVIESAEEFSFCYNFIARNHEKKKKKLSPLDAKSMKGYLKYIKDAAKVELLETKPLQEKKMKGSIFKKTIERKDYRKVFDLVCQLYGLPQRTQLTNAGSIYDGDIYLEIPRWEAFASITVERLLKLLTHEIESHYINAYNGRILLGNFRWAKNLPKEEWLAMFMERIYHGYNYDNITSIVESSFTMLAWECLPGKDFEDFMRIMGKEYKCKYSYTNAVIRSKRNYSLTYPGVQHKDVVYFRGLSDTVRYLKDWGAFFKLFLWKVWYSDVDNLYDIYQASEKKDECIFPIFISDLITYYLLEKEKDKNFIFHSWEYYLYLKKKYWFLDLWDFNIIKQINDKWKKIEQVISVLEKAL